MVDLARKAYKQPDACACRLPPKEEIRAEIDRPTAS
jgi:hypothetical protein